MLNKMKVCEIVGDVIDQLPKTVLRVNFENAEVHFGNQLTMEEVSCKPVIIDWDSHPHMFYTLCLTDPDAPSRSNPGMRERVHWLVGNIPGSSKNPSEGENVIEFVPSCPPNGSGLHRYTFLLYEHADRVQFSPEDKIDDSKEMWDLRKNFSIRNFARKYCLGEAFAANFYIAQWDLNAQLTRQRLGLE